MTVIRTPTAAFNDQPFSGQGVSLYATIGSAVVYRNIRILGGRRRGRSGWIKGSAGTRGYGSGVSKTARRTSTASPDTSIDWTLPAAFKPATATFDVRHYKDHVENENDGFRTQTVAISAGGAGTSTINATATLLEQEQRQGGVVRLRIVVHETLDGVQPILVRASRTAGPSSPSSVTVAYSPRQRIVVIDTPALSDASAYTYKITLENGATTSDVITGISVVADATGPPVPLFVTAEDQ